MTPLRLLQVEDTEDDAALVQLALTRAGYDVVARRVDCCRGAAPRAARIASWDLVIADYTMPRFSGTKALAIVREQHPGSAVHLRVRHASAKTPPSPP